MDVMTAVGGVTMFDEQMLEPQPIMLLCLLIPASAFVLLFVRKIKNRKMAFLNIIGFGGI